MLLIAGTFLGGLGLFLLAVSLQRLRDRAGTLWAPVLLHALLNLRDLPESQREAWRGLFDYYIFGPREHAVGHIPEAGRGSLGELNDATARRIRAMLRNNLNR